MVTGVAGIGKTALAVHWSHRAAAFFPDGCLHVDLGSAPAAPGEVLGRLLRSLGVTGDRLPDDEVSRVSLYRRLLRGRRVLVVLDDASSFAQVAPLLPANGGCCVVVTSRESMEELVLRHGAVRVPLGVLDRADSTALLDRIVTGGRTAASRAQTARLAELCDGLPLALCIAAARLATRPHWTVRRLADRLADEHRRLDELSLGGSRVRASFELSHGCLSPRLASVYRRLSLLDVPDVPAWAVAALLDCPVETAEQYLDELTDAHLLEVSGPDATGQYRYRFQSLLRLYARERAQEDPDRPAAEAARDRALHSWLTVAEAAHRREYGGDHSVVHGPAPRPHVDRDLLDDLLARPLDWFDSERHCLVAAVTQSARLGLAALAWDLAASTVGFCEIRSNTDDWRRLCEEGLAASRAAGDRQGEGVMLGELGAALLYRGESEASVRLLEEADGVLRAGGEVYGAALNACKLAVVVRQRGDADAARVLLDGALPALRAAGDLSAQAHALNNLAQIALDAGDPEEAVRLGREAVALARGWARPGRCPGLPPAGAGPAGGRAAPGGGGGPDRGGRDRTLQARPAGHGVRPAGSGRGPSAGRPRRPRRRGPHRRARPGRGDRQHRPHGPPAPAPRRTGGGTGTGRGASAGGLTRAAAVQCQGSVRATTGCGPPAGGLIRAVAVQCQGSVRATTGCGSPQEA
ncbi:tetratricopeptide repeat protein [Streptomyces diastatochromogenes]|nr:tetratricopeptide repeat protein [Streptomyces diastatochromogenes]